MKDGYKTSEGWLTLAVAVLGMVGVIYGIHPTGHVDPEHDHMQCIKEAILGVASAVASVVATWKYIQSRADLKGLQVQADAMLAAKDEPEEEEVEEPRRPMGFSVDSPRDDDD